MSTRALLLTAMAYLLVLALVAFGLPLGIGYSQRVRSEVRTQARSQANIVAISADPLVEAGGTVRLRALVRGAARSVRGRVLIVDRRGLVLADSGGTGTEGVSYRSRPEVAAALRGERVQEERTSATLDQRLLVTAVPIDGASPQGAVRITQDTKAITRAVRRNLGGLLLVAFAVLAFGLLIAVVLARRLSDPVRRLQDAAERVAEGDLEAVVEEEGPREQRALARSFNAMTGRVSRAMRSQQDFVADASHQLRTPLAGMRLRLEAAQADELSPDAQRHLAAATNELDRLSQMIDELLLLSQTGERDAPGEVLDLADVVAGADERWASTLVDADQALVIEVGRPASVQAARVDVDRALDALIENASRYTPAGTSITVRNSGSVIEVIDTGPGLSDEDLEHVFDRFTRGGVGRRSGPGTGLGLPIARELIGRWGGEVTLENRAEGGAVARLTFPLRSAEPHRLVTA